MINFEETKLLLGKSNIFYIIATSMDGNYSYVNNHYEQNFRHIHGEIIGQPYYITMHEHDVKTCQEVGAKCFAHPDKTFPATIRKHDGNGGYVITQWEYKAMLDPQGQPAGIFCLGYDITQYVTDRSDLTKARREIEKKNSILTNIAFDQSHVIRRPLANILGLCLMLQKMDMDQNLRNICEMLFDSSRQLDEAIKMITNKTYDRDDQAMY